MRSLLAFALAVALLPACGGSNGGGGGGGDDDDEIDGGGGGGVDGRPAGTEHTVTWGPVTVPPGQENTQCVTKRLGNDAEIRVGKIHNVLGAASHHLIVYRLSPEAALNDDPIDCDPFVDVLDPAKGAPLAVTQIKDEVIELPEGVAFTLAEDQVVRLEMHFVNASGEPVEMNATSTFIEIASADFQHEADFLFVGNPDIDIAAHTTATVGPSFLPLPPELADINVFAITGHQHRFGTGVQVATAPSAEGADTMVYDPPGFEWDEPPTVYHEPPFSMAAGAGFRFSCAFNNTSDQSVGFGENANDEMCFFWAYYYPSQGAKVCVHSDNVLPNPVDLCCPSESPLCDILQAYLDPPE